jgi:ribosomal protein S20
MSKNTVKPGLTRKRAKRVVENHDYASFARRILKAYARRVAAGDIEALSSLVLFPSDVDALTRTAVKGLREFGYSWSEIAGRLGVSRQAAQMRYGDKSEIGQLDRRIIDAGISVTVGTLVQVFADHHPGVPAASACPACRYRYPAGVSDCPTNAMVRPVLYQRRGEDHDAMQRLTDDQRADLHSKTTARKNRVAARQAAHTTPSPDRHAPSLFDLLPATAVDILDGKDSSS